MPLIKKTCEMLILFLVLMVSFTTLVFAFDCYAPSPSYHNGNTPFDRIITRELTDSEINILEKISQWLSTNHWAGESFEISCHGRIEDFYIKETSFNLSADVEINTESNLSITTELQSRDENTRHFEYVELIIIDNRLRFMFNHVESDVEIIELSSDRIEFLTRSIIGSIRREIFFMLTLEPGAFIIDFSVFIQGRLNTSRVRYYYQTR